MPEQGQEDRPQGLSLRDEAIAAVAARYGQTWRDQVAEDVDAVLAVTRSRIETMDYWDPESSARDAVLAVLDGRDA